jgi:hypothetical protein
LKKTGGKAPLPFGFHEFHEFHHILFPPYPLKLTDKNSIYFIGGFHAFNRQSVSLQNMAISETKMAIVYKQVLNYTG